MASEKQVKDHGADTTTTNGGFTIKRERDLVYKGSHTAKA